MVQIASYQRLLQCVNALHDEVYYLPGNHDSISSMQATLGYQLGCGVIEANAWVVLYLNTHLAGEEKGHLSSEDLNLLASQLKIYRQKYVLVALHHHPIPIGSQWLDTMVLDNRNRFFETLTQSGNVRGVICGHISPIAGSLSRLDSNFGLTFDLLSYLDPIA